MSTWSKGCSDPYCTTWRNYRLPSSQPRTFLLSAVTSFLLCSCPAGFAHSTELITTPQLSGAGNYSRTTSSIRVEDKWSDPQPSLLGTEDGGGKEWCYSWSCAFPQKADPPLAQSCWEGVGCAISVFFLMILYMLSANYLHNSKSHPMSVL